MVEIPPLPLKYLLDCRKSSRRRRWLLQCAAAAREITAALKQCLNSVKHYSISPRIPFSFDAVDLLELSGISRWFGIRLCSRVRPLQEGKEQIAPTCLRCRCDE